MKFLYLITFFLLGCASESIEDNHGKVPLFGLLKAGESLEAKGRGWVLNIQNSISSDIMHIDYKAEGVDVNFSINLQQRGEPFTYISSDGIKMTSRGYYNPSYTFEDPQGRVWRVTISNDTTTFSNREMLNKYLKWPFNQRNQEAIGENGLFVQIQLSKYEPDNSYDFNISLERLTVANSKSVKLSSDQLRGHIKVKQKNRNFIRQTDSEG